MEWSIDVSCTAAMILKVSAISGSVLDHGMTNSSHPHESLSQIIDVKLKVKVFLFSKQ